MGSAIIRLFNAPQGSPYWRNVLVDLGHKLDASRARAEGNEAARGVVAVAAATGDAPAQAELDRLNADRYGLELDISNLSRAIHEAEKRLNETTADEAATALERERVVLRRDLRERNRLAREIEGTLRSLAGDLAKLDEATGRCLTRARAVGVAVPSDRHGLEPDAINGRLCEYLAHLGIPEGIMGAQAPIMRPAIGSYAEAEAKAARFLDPASEPGPEAA